MTNLRIVTANGVTTEAIANYIHFRYDPVKPDVSVQFAFQKYVLDANGKVTPHSSPDQLLTRDAAQFVGNKVAVGLKSEAGVSLDFLTGADMVMILKHVADKWYNEAN